MKALARTTDLRVMVLGPLNAIKKIAEISSDWNVVLVRLELLVEELVVRRFLFQYNRVSSEQVRKTIRRDCSVNVHLVLVLTSTNDDP